MEDIVAWEQIKGWLDSVTYYNEETHFLVGRFREEGRDEITIIVGCMAGPVPGERMNLSGERVINPRFGPQFQVEQFEILPPVTVEGIEKYLASGVIKGIGPVTASRIVKKFGLETLEILEKEPGRLSDVRGIGANRLAAITSSWQEQRQAREAMVYIQSLGITPAYASRIIRQFGAQTVEVVRSDPYRLAGEVEGIGFIQADRIARRLGFSLDDPGRIDEGVLYILKEAAAASGHVFLPGEMLASRAERLLEVEPARIWEGLDRLAEKERVKVDTLPEGEEAVYLSGLYRAEDSVARWLLSHQILPSAFDQAQKETMLRWLEEEEGGRLLEEQAEALRLAASNKVMILTGGPGTGKTTTLRSLISMFSRAGARLALAAPTGRAAKRMEEAAGAPASTIHRLLEYNPGQGDFQRDQHFPLDADVVIIDESSMVDVILMYQLLKALPPGASLILSGDADQLPPVGPGNVFRELVESESFPVIRLKRVFRQSETSRIVINAHLINQGRPPDIEIPPDISDFYYIEENNPQRVVDKVVRLCRERIPARFSLHPLADIQVVAPMHRGTAGVDNLNRVLQEVLNPGEFQLERGGRLFRTGDKVMQMVNNYEREVFNGDTGRIEFIDQDNYKLGVNFDDRLVVYGFDELDQVNLAYAISVHKSQGSEYPAVVLPLLDEHRIMLQRSLLYTAVTRGRKLVVLLGSRRALGWAVANNRIQQRFSRLSWRLQRGIRGHGLDE